MIRTVALVLFLVENIVLLAAALVNTFNELFVDKTHYIVAIVYIANIVLAAIALFAGG